MYHSFLIHLSANGHLGCFHVLAIVNSAVMNIGVHMSLSDLVSSVYMPRSGNGNGNPICKTEKETQMYRTDLWTLGEGEGRMF